MTPDEFETCWVPVPLRWRHVVAGDVIVGKLETPHIVHVVGSMDGQLAVRLYGYDHPFPVDPDEVIEVLTPVPMVQAVALTREQIGMQLIGRRTEDAA